MKRTFMLISLLCCIILAGAQNKSTAIDKTFENITEVEINVVFSDVIVKSVEGNTVSVKGTIKWDRDKDKYEIKTRQSGTILIVDVDHPQKAKGRVSGELYLTMPAMTDVNINSISGDIKISGVGQRKVKCNTVSGDITANKIGSDLHATNVSGNIELDDIKGSVKSNTISGNHTINNVDGNFKGSSISGNFRITNLKGSRDISTLSGNVH